MEIEIEASSTVGELILKKIQKYSDVCGPYIDYHIFESMFSKILEITIQRLLDAGINVDSLITAMEIEIKSSMCDTNAKEFVKGFLDAQSQL